MAEAQSKLECVINGSLPLIVIGTNTALCYLLRNTEVDMPWPAIIFFLEMIIFLILPMKLTKGGKDCVFAPLGFYIPVTIITSALFFVGVFQDKLYFAAMDWSGFVFLAALVGAMILPVVVSLRCACYAWKNPNDNSQMDFLGRKIKDEGVFD